MTTLQERPNGTPGGSSMNLEKEFTCSICTEILYRPLTLLDCLHTFCGGCLKQWFSFQKAAIERKMNEDGRLPAILYTCPSCRADVRDTKGNATVTSLLEMYLKMHPEKDKSKEEKEELDAAYKRGDSVLPPPPRAMEERHASERDITRAMQGSTISGSSSSSRSSDTRLGSARVGRLAPGTNEAARVPDTLEYQSSIRSILSGTEFDSIATEEEIMQLVMQEGLLNGIDLHNLTPAQEDEIIGQIALAYRRKERARAREAEETRRRDVLQSRQRELSQTRRDTDRTQSRQRDSSRTRHRETTERRSRQNTSHPPVSRPHLLDTGSDSSQNSLSASAHQDTGRNSTQTTRHRRHTSAERTDRPATRSATDLTLRPESNNRLAGISDTGITVRRVSRSTERSSTDPQPRGTAEAMRSGEATSIRNPSSSRRVRVSAVPPNNQILTMSVPRTRPRTSSGPLPHHQVVSSLPELNCDGCGKQHIECDVHYKCKGCSDLALRAYSLCRSCYRRGEGCPHWTGFGPYHASSLQNLRPERYIRHENSNIVYQQGRFCDTCGESADACYWNCDSCNDGEWGYCDKCVNQGRICRHALLATVVNSSPTEVKLNPARLKISCDSCRQTIHSEYLHCPTCNVDLCRHCQRATGRNTMISPPENDPGAWHRCLKGHRMQDILISPCVGDDFARGLNRTIHQDVEGGWASKSVDGTHRVDPESTVGETTIRSSRTPWDVGRTMVAVWTRIPDDGVEDELSFPRGAEITEVKEINEDWSYGVYCRMTGLFPSNHVRPKV